MALFDVFNGFATLLLSGVGGPATLLRVTRSYDEATGLVTEATSTIPINVALKRVQAGDDDGVSTSEAALVSDTALVTGDRVILQGKTYVIGTVDYDAPDGRPIIWTGQVKR